MAEYLNRRQVLAGGLALVTVGLAGCSDEDDGTGNEDGGGGAY